MKRIAIVAGTMFSVVACLGQQRQPNIVFILADDMGYGDVSYLGGDSSRLNTAHIDRLAREGFIFTDAHSSSSVSTPTRYGILTGRYNWRSDLKEGVLYGYDKALIPQGRETIASMLKRQGYTTAGIGKWHLGWDWANVDAGKEKVDFSAYDWVYIEGYMFYSAVLPTVMRRAKAAGCRIGLDLASFEVVRDFREDLPDILRNYVDIVLANEEEAAALFDGLTTEEQLDRLASWCDIAAIKLGRRGALIRRGNETAKVPAQLVEEPVDTTAAGDLWAAGFLYGVLRERPLMEAAWYGSLISSEVVKVVGSELPEPAWNEIKGKIAK